MIRVACMGLALSAASLAGHAVTLLGHDLSQPVLPYIWESAPGNDIRWYPGGDVRKAVGVTIAPGTPYRFDSFTAMVALATLDQPDYAQSEQLHAAIYADGTGGPGAMLADLGVLNLSALQPVASPFAAQFLTWSSAAPVVLEGGKTYWFALNDNSYREDMGIPVAHWSIMASGSGTLPTGVGGLAGYRYTVNGVDWLSSGRYNAMQIEVSAVPEPATWVLWLTGGLGLLRLRRRHI